MARLLPRRQKCKAMFWGAGAWGLGFRLYLKLHVGSYLGFGGGGRELRGDPGLGFEAAQCFGLRAPELRVRAHFPLRRPSA